MDPLLKLHSLLSSYLESTDIEVQDLYYELVAARPLLRQLFDVAPRSASEKCELQSGRVKIAGNMLAINESFAAEAIFLSESLDVSELHCVELLELLIRLDPNRTQEQRVEKAIYLYHSRRNSMLTTLNLIITGAYQEEITGSGDMLKNFVVEQLFQGEAYPLNSSRRGGYGEKILEEMDKTGQLINRVAIMIRDAKSDTNIKTSGLGRYILEERMKLLKSERTQLAFLLYRASKLHFISALDVTKLIKWLSETTTNDVSPYIICAVLAAINPVSNDGKGVIALLRDPVFSKFAAQQLGKHATWKAPRSKGTKALLNLAWSLLGRWILASGMKFQTHFSEDDIENDIRQAIEEDAFQRLLMLVIQADPEGPKFGHDPLSYAATLRQEIPELADHQDSSFSEVVDGFFKPSILNTAEGLVTDLIGFAPSVLKSLRTRQEDLLGANARTRGSTTVPPKLKPRNDIAVFFVLLGTLYTCLAPESALTFWQHSDTPPQSNFPKFLRWAADARESSTARAMFEMVAGLCHGKNCSEEAYNFLSIAGASFGESGITGSTALLSWRSLFRALDTWNATIPNPRLPSQGGPRDPRMVTDHALPPIITPEEVYHLSSFLTVLRAIAANSARARLLLFNHSAFKILQCLISLIPRHIPLELKGSIFQTIAAFCTPGAGVPGVELCKEIWYLLEEAEVIGVKHTRTLFGSGTELDSGVAFELEEIELPAKRYPSSLGFIKLLSSLIHAPKAIPLNKRMLQYEPTSTVPDNLGSPRRPPSILPYTRFVIERIIIPTLNGSQEYTDTEDKWKMLEASFTYLENCLASYSMEDLFQIDLQGNSAMQSVATRLLMHPGFAVLHEMLTDSPLISAILNYVHQGTLYMESQESNSSLIGLPFQNTMLRVLRILHRVLEIQSPFLEVFAPMAAELDTKAALGSQFSVSVLTGLDQRLVWSPERVVSIALCAVYAQDDELILMAIRTLSTLAGSPFWTTSNQSGSVSSRRHINRLAVALDRNADSEKILSTFVRLLNTDASEEISEAELEHSTGAGAVVKITDRSLTEALRWEVLDLLIENTDGNRPGPNLAHLLLGFSQEGTELMLEDSHAAGAHVSCLHVILRHLSRGIESPVVGATSQDRHLPPLYRSNTILAEKCYRLIYQLCIQDLTRDSTMRYLRNQESFFAQQLSAIPSIVPEARSVGTQGIVHYADQTQITTSCETATSFLRLRSYLLEVVAQEIHLLTQAGQRRSVKELVNVLFSSSNLSSEATDGYTNTLLTSPFTSRQSLDRIIELFFSFDFEWKENSEIEAVEVAFYRSVNLTSALRTDSAGCELIDREALMQMLQKVKAQSQNELTSSAALTQLERETSYILCSCTMENHRREIQHAKGLGLESWRRLLDVCLSKCFDHLSSERRESFLCDLLIALPSVIGSGGISTFGMISLSETVLGLMTKLRDERAKYETSASFDETRDLGASSDKLISIFKGVLECVLDPNAPELVRGNLYAALIGYFHMFITGAVGIETIFDPFSDVASLDGNLTKPLNGASNSKQAGLGILAQTLQLVNMVVDKLIQVISRDAIDGSELWKSVAFAMMDCLIRLSRREKRHRVLATLVKQGVLHTFVGSISELDVDLEMIYSPDPVDLNSLFVYESKMSLLVRISQTRQGAERLLEHRIFETLSRCVFISARPELDQMSRIDRATFLPSALQRYHQLLLPALQLANSVLAAVTISSKHYMKQTINFVLSHREMFVLLLKDSSSETSLALLREQQLIVSLNSHLLPALDSGELVASDFAPLHAAVLTLAAKYLRPKPRLSIRPIDDADLLADSTALQYDGRRSTRFEIFAEEAFEALRTSIVEYLAFASNTAGTEFRCVLSPHPAVTDEEQPNALALQPSIGDIIYALNRNLDVLNEVLRQIDNVAHKLSNPESISIEDLSKMRQSVELGTVLRPSALQLRVVAVNELNRVQNEVTSRAMRLMHSVEVLMLLIWRHTIYFQSGRYLEDQYRSNKSHSSKPRYSGIHSLSTSLYPRNSQPSTAVNLLHTLANLETVKWPNEIFGRDANSRESFLHVLCRKLKEAVYLGQELEGNRSLEEDGL